MTFAAPTWTGLTKTMGRGLRGFGRGTQGDAVSESHARVPLKREDMAALFELDQQAAGAQEQISQLRTSERTERESMSMIRAALYPQE